MQQKLKDGARYLVTFNQGQDCVEASYIAEYKLFSHISGSISLADAEKIESVKPDRSE